MTPLDEDTLVLGFMRFVSPCMITGTLESDLTGSFSYDRNLDGTVEDTADVETADCDSIL